MPKRTPRKGGENLRRLIVEVPEDMLRTLRIRAAEQDTTIKQIVTRALERELKGGESKKK
jgi:hypothetical protein